MSGDAKAPRHRNYCFTVNALDSDPLSLRLLDPTHESWRDVRYLVYQREFGTHEHFQGYIEFTNQKTMATVHEFEGLERSSLFPRRGSAKQADHYVRKPLDGCTCEHCEEERREPTKLEGPWSFGEMSAQGQRAELLEIQKEIHKGVSLKRISEDHFPEHLRFGKAIKDYKRTHTLPRQFKTRVFLFCGPPGHGKSTVMKLVARYLGSCYKAPSKKGSGQYFDDYDGEDTMIIDEFDGSRMRPTEFNDIADEHECILTCHGGAGHQMISKYLFIGSNYPPHLWWKNRSPEEIRQTTRRIDVVFKMGFRNTPRWDHSSWQVFGPNINQPPKDKNELFE